MQTAKLIHTVSCHAAGEVGDVIIGGVQTPPGDTLWEQSRFIARDQKLRNFMLNEPRGGVFRHVNLLVPPKNSKAQMGFIIMEPEDTPPMSGSNTICVTTVLLETGILEMHEPVTCLTLEVPAGLVNVKAYCEKGKVKRVLIENVKSFVDHLSAVIEVEGVGSLTVSTAYGGDSFVLIDANQLGFSLDVSEARELAETGILITNQANEQLGFYHPENPHWKHISFCQFTGSLKRNQKGILTGKNAVVIQPGKIDRSPTGTGVSARLALLYAQGKIKKEECYLARSLIGSSFEGYIKSESMIGKDKTAIIPEISGQAWITGTHQHFLDPEDPWQEGYRLSDTWPDFTKK